MCAWTSAVKKHDTRQTIRRYIAQKCYKVKRYSMHGLFVFPTNLLKNPFYTTICHTRHSYSKSGLGMPNRAAAPMIVNDEKGGEAIIEWRYGMQFAHFVFRLELFYSGFQEEIFPQH
ncbi:hypothetical protein EVAR_45433_1 [Eumeta japonica]|uniref:Uncharacterized protein n=1 Tax=Eumeta variegata TaxID=151549 RepID=A0A4C1YJS7_EUMVA|nr:hypothetical protein EVAR_45433_1 [Eumeta japonica]